MSDHTTLLGNRATRLAAAIEVCQARAMDCVPALMDALSSMTWEEVVSVSPYLPLLGEEAVEPLCALLASNRKQTVDAAASALGEIGDARACSPLAAMMETQAGQANAQRARDALIGIGPGAAGVLVEALGSTKWEVRYHAIQALAAIGDVARSDVIEQLNESFRYDRSERVQEAAAEALQLIPNVAVDALYATKTGLYNPWLLDCFSMDWRVDVINGSNGGVLWRFRLSELEPFAERNEVTHDYPCARACLKAANAIGASQADLDIIILLADIIVEGSPAEEFGIQVAAPNPSVSTPALLSYLRELDRELQSIPGCQTPEDRLVSVARLTPFLHLEYGKLVQYVMDDAYEPDATRVDDDERFGSGLETSFALGAVDDAWVYRRYFTSMKEQGRFAHIPFLREGRDAGE